MAEVFLAKESGSSGLERLVAIKRIHSHLAASSRFVSMLRDEANIAGRFNHANIAHIHDIGQIDGQYYIAMEYVQGRDLRAIFDRCQKLGRPVPIAESCNLIMAVCEGLESVHNCRDYCGRDIGLVHRDISPHNLIVSFDGGVKIIDFGIAKAIGRVVDSTGVVCGKLTYMSPEQVRGLPIDRRSDVFSTGVVLFELLTGQRLFGNGTVAEVLNRVHEATVPPPSELNPEICPELAAIVLRALAREPEDRYPSAGALHAALTGYVQDRQLYLPRARIATWLRSLYETELAEELAYIARLWSRTPSNTMQHACSATSHGDGAFCSRFAATLPGWRPATAYRRQHGRDEVTRQPERSGEEAKRSGASRPQQTITELTGSDWRYGATLG